MAHLNFLEQFQCDDTDSFRGPLPEELPGYDAGYAAGIAAAAADSTRLSAELLTRLGEMQFGYAEARQDLLRALGPFIDALCSQILPSIQADAERSMIAETLLLAARADVTGPIIVTVHPDKSAAVQSAIEGFSQDAVQVADDALLGTDDILISTATRETQLNVAAMIAELSDVLRMIPAQPEGVPRHV